MLKYTLELEDYQSTLFPYAYNILGSSEEAKDVVQDTIVKFLTDDHEEIKNLTGYMIRTVINQAINVKKRNSKITDNKVWLPEPLSTEKTDASINQEELISYSLLVMLEKLTAKERAVFILKEGFDYAHEEIAQIMDFSIENSRKLLSRAKSKLGEDHSQIEKKRDPIIPNYFDRYIQAIKKGDLKSLEKLLSDDIYLMADGGSNVNVVQELTVGKEATLEILHYVFQTYQVTQEVKVSEINHQPALLFYEAGQLVNCQVFDLTEGRINKVFSIVDPEKLVGIPH